MPILLEIIHDENYDNWLRMQALNSLSYIKDPEVPNVMVNIYYEFSNLEAALGALENVDYQYASHALSELLNHEDWRIRKSAVSAIARTGNANVWDELAAKYTDESEKVRAELSKGLGVLGFDAVIPTLLMLIRDSSSIVRQEALNSLDLAFPNIAQQTFLELANEPAYPERIKAIEFLGHYRSSEVRNTLRSLCIDSNTEVKTQAVNSLHRIDQNLNAELGYVRTGKRSQLVHNPLIRMFDRVKTTYSALTWQAKRLGLSERERTTWIIQQFQNDAEIRRENRSFFILISFVLNTLFVIAPPVLAATVPRVSIYLGNIFWANKWFSGIHVALALVSLVPKIRESAKIRNFRYLYTYFRLMGFTILIVTLVSLGSYYWWICIPFLILIGSGVYFLRKYKVSKRTQTAS